MEKKRVYEEQFMKEAIRHNKPMIAAETYTQKEVNYIKRLVDKALSLSRDIDLDVSLSLDICIEKTKSKIAMMQKAGDFRDMRIGYRINNAAQIYLKPYNLPEGSTLLLPIGSKHNPEKYINDMVNVTIEKA